MESVPVPTYDDVRMARDAAAGSGGAWHDFVLCYSGLIQATVRRYMAGFDPDDQRTAYVEVLTHLHRDGLRRYNGSVTLASWVMIVARNRCLDHVRGRNGRKRPPAWLANLPAFDAEVYRWFYVEGMDLQETTAALRRSGKSPDHAAVAAALDRLADKIDGRTNLACELRERQAAGSLARLAEFVDEQRRRNAEQEEAARPDALLIRQEVDAMLERVRQAVDALPPDTRAAIELHYWENLGPTAMAARLELGTRRRAQGLLRRALEQLRRISMIDDTGGTPGTPSRPA